MDYKNDSDSFIDLYLVINSVEGLEKGGYFFNPRNNSIDLLKDLPGRNISTSLLRSIPFRRCKHCNIHYD